MAANRSAPKDGEGPARRSFLNGFLGTAFAALGAAVVFPVLRFVSPPRIPEAVTNQVL